MGAGPCGPVSSYLMHCVKQLAGAAQIGLATPQGSGTSRQLLDPQGKSDRRSFITTTASIGSRAGSIRSVARPGLQGGHRKPKSNVASPRLRAAIDFAERPTDLGRDRALRKGEEIFAPTVNHHVTKPRDDHRWRSAAPAKGRSFFGGERMQYIFANNGE